MTHYRDDMSAAEEAALLTECDALDAAYGDAERWHAERAPEPKDADPEDHYDPMAELRKAALSNGQP